MISCSSVPRRPPSPLWGLRLSTAMRGMSMPKSSFSEVFIRRSLLSILSLLMERGTSLRGMWPVTTPRRSLWLVISMVTSETPNCFCRYSVCPGKPKPSPDMAFLLMGPVTRASINPSFMSDTARARAVIAAFADSGVACPGSANTLSGRQLSILIRLGLASAAFVITLVSSCSISCIVLR